MLKPALSRGEVQVIGATTLDEYRRYIEKNGALERRFQPIIVQPPTVPEAIDILRGLKERSETHHRAKIPDGAIVQAVKLSDRYVSDRYLPDKAIDVMDEAGSRVRLAKETMPARVRDLQRQIAEIVRQKKEFIEKQEFERAVELRDKEEDLRRDVEAEKKQWEDMRDDVEPIVTEEDIAYVVSRMTGVPLSKIEESEASKLLRIEEELHRRVVGQDEAIKAIGRAIRRSRAGLKDVNRPVGTFIFLGPTGVGKTELARTLAEFLFGDEDALIRIDMSEYMERFAVSRLVGAPPGYVGYDEGGQLTERVRRRPYSVVLFDEIEKAHPDVFHILLQVMDDGRLTDSYGRSIDFKNVILIMTSNMGGRTIEKQTALGFQRDSETSAMEKMRENIKQELKRVFNPEFLNRIDESVMFHPLSLDHIVQIVDIQVERLNKQLIEKGLTIEVDEEAKHWLAEKGYDPSFGARPLKRVIQKYIEDPLSEEVVRGHFKEGGIVEVRRSGEELGFALKKDMVESAAQ
jgi:ATP-dependent Clp protease ATP-binding subunit ClpC